ncbi:MAG: choice-of-anchor D domain-containing protein [Candidatus Zixiibacteriota bacterium]
MRKLGFLLILLSAVLIFGSVGNKVPAESANMHVEFETGSHLNEFELLGMAKKAGDIDGARAIQARVDERYDGFSEPVSIESDSRLEPIRRSMAEKPVSKDFGDDIWLAGFVGKEEAPTIASHSDGTLYAAFEANNASIHEHTYIQVRYSNDNGETWSDFFRITNPSTNLNEPHVIVGEGAQDWVFIAYNKEDPSYVEVARISTSGMGGDIYTIETPSFTSCKNIRIATDNEDYYYLYVAYIRNAMLDTDVHFARSTDFGESWSVSDIASEGKHHCDIAVGGNMVYIVAQKGDIDESGKIYTKMSNNRGYSFTSDADITTTNKDNFPRIAASEDGETAVMTYTYAYSASDHDVYYSYTTNGGEDWTMSRFLALSIRDEKYSDIARIGDGYSIAFNEQGRVKMASTANLASGFSSAENVSDEATAIEYFPSIAPSWETPSGCPAIVWNLRFTDSDYDILFDRNCCIEVTAGIDAEPESGDAPIEIEFSDASTGLIDERTWWIDGSEVSTEESFSHLFDESGEHTVVLEVVNWCSRDMDTMIIDITCPDVTADFTATPATGTAPLYIEFSDESTGDITEYQWDIGGEYSPTVPNPTHTFSTAGTYEVKLTVTNACGSTDSSIQTISVFAPSGPSIDYSPSALNFGEQSIEDCSQLWITLENSGDEILTLSDERIAPEQFSIASSFPSSIPAGNSDSVLIEFCPDAITDYTGVLQFGTNDDGHPAVEIALSGSGVESATPGLTFTPNPVEYDSIPLYEEVSRRITVRNTGSEAISITGLYMASGPSAGAFAISGADTFTVEPGAYRYITVNFNPNEDMEYNATLRVSTTVGEMEIPLHGYGYTSMSCRPYGRYQICSSHIDGDRVYGNIAFLNSEGDTVITLVSLGEVGAFVDLSLGAGTGRAVFHYEDGSKSTVFLGAFDLNSSGFRFRFTGDTDMLPDSIRDAICPDSLLGMPFSYKAGIDPVVVNVADGWWKLQGGVSVKNGTRVIGNIDVSRQRFRDMHTEWDVEDFNISLYDGVFQFGFTDIDVDGDTISARRIHLTVDESLLPSSTFIDRGAFGIDARSLLIVDGKLTNLDATMRFPDFVIPAGGGHVALRRPELRLVWNDGEIVRVAGGARFETPGLTSEWGETAYISAHIDIIRSRGVDGVELSFWGWSPGVPLGTTGFFMTGVSGEVRHMTAPESLWVQLSCQIKGGPSVPVLGSVVELDPEITVDFAEGYFNLDGAARFLEHLARGHAGLTYRHHDVGGAWGIEGYANLRAGVSRRIYIEGGTDLHIWQDTGGGFHLAGYGFVEGHLEHNALFWLAPTRDISVGVRAWYGEFRHGGDSGGHWGVKGQADVEIFGLRPAFSYIDGRLSTMEGAWNYTPADEFRYHYHKAALVREEVPYDIGETDINIFQVRTAEDVEPIMKLTLPDGNTITTDSCSTEDDSAELYFFSEVSMDGHRYTGFSVRRNAPGTWTATIDSIPSGDTDHPMQVTGIYAPISLDLDVSTSDDGFSISGPVDGLEDGDEAWVKLYLQKIGQDGANYLIDEVHLTESFEIDESFTFEEIGATGGDYFVHAFAQDAHDRIAFFADSATVITAPEDETPPAAPAGFTATWTDTTVRAKWDIPTEADVAGFKLYKGFETDDIWWWEEIDLAWKRSVIIPNVQVMVPDTCEFVLGLTAYDASGNESEMSIITPEGRDAEDRDTEAPSITIDDVDLDLAAREATIRWTSDDVDIAGYILYIGTEDSVYSQKVHIDGFSFEYTMTKLLVGSNYYIKLIAYDDYLNTSEPAEYIITFYDEYDVDGDGLPDWWEVFYFGDYNAYGRDDDPDEDLVSNINEYLAGTNPNSPDTDGDGVPDLSEIASSELDPNCDADNDGDRLPDDWEWYFFGTDTITDLGNQDPDEDWLTNSQEFEHRTDPHNPDTDGGGIYDGIEVIYSLNPLQPADDDNMEFSIYFSRGWNMISVPLHLNDSTVAGNFPDALGVFYYDTEEGEYIAPEYIRPGIGYFVLYDEPIEKVFEGSPVYETSFDMKYGWNLVGVPLTINGMPLELSSTEPEGLVMDGSIYAYNGDIYIPAEMILASGYGYWMLSEGDGELTIGDGDIHKISIFSSEESSETPPPPPPVELEDDEDVIRPSNLSIHGAYPNPFNGSCDIVFDLVEDGIIDVGIYDVEGREIASIIENTELASGTHSVPFNAVDNDGQPLQSGVYFYKIEIENATIDQSQSDEIIGKLIYIK